MAVSTLPKFLTDIPIKILESGDNLNNYNDSGFYYIKSGISNAPQDWAWLLVIGGLGAVQVCFSSTVMYIRAYTGSPLAWTSWRYASTQPKT